MWCVDVGVVCVDVCVDVDVVVVYVVCVDVVHADV